MAECIVAQT